MIDLNSRQSDFFVPENFFPGLKKETLDKIAKEVSHTPYRGKVKFGYRTNCATDTECDLLEKVFKETWKERLTRWYKKLFS